MKRQFPAFLSGVLVTVLLLGLGVSALAATGKLTLEVDPVAIRVGGELFQPKDEKGRDVPLFAYNGTTYAPVRALAKAYGLYVGFDKAAGIVWVNDTPEAAVPAADAARKNKVNVSTAADLVAAIAPDTEIILAPGTYDLTGIAGKGGTAYATWVETYDGYELTIQNVNGLTIRGQGAAGTSILTGSTYPSVLQFSGCTDVVLSGFTAGHKTNEFCVGSVLGFDYTAGVRISDCSLYGCGSYGVYTWMTSNVTVEQTEIYGCSSGAVGLFDSSNITFNGCEFRDNVKSDSVASIWGTTGVTFSNCLIRNNQAPVDYEYETMLFSLEDASGVLVKDCTIRSNSFEQFFSIYETGEGITTQNCKFESNTFTTPK